MAYTPPSLTMNQNFDSVATSNARPVAACVMGPAYELHRFTEATEKALIAAYDRTQPSTEYAWPNHVAGGIVDLATASIWMQDTLLRYFNRAASGNLTVAAGNKILTTFNLATNSYAARDAALGSRDVAVGDAVKVEWVDPGTGDPMSFDSVVAAVSALTVAGTSAPVNARAAGFGDTVVGATADATYVPPGAFDVSYDAAAYDGLAAGYPSDVYTVVVESVGYGTTSGGSFDGTVLRIYSAGGDPVMSVTLGSTDALWSGGDNAYEITLGSRGALMYVADAGTGGTGLVAAGDYWKVTIAQNYTEVDVTDSDEFDSVGPYTGLSNTTYTVQCTSGGVIGADDLIFSYRTSNNADTAGTLSVPAADFAAVLYKSYSIGAAGMTLKFVKTTAWNTGDIVSFTVAAATDGNTRYLTLADSVDALTTDDLTISLYVETTVQMSSTFYALSADLITILGSATVVSTLLGTSAAYPVYGGDLYASYREQLTVGANVVGSVTSTTEIEAALGPIVTTNPLAYGVNQTALLAAGTVVYYIMLESDDLAGYTAAMAALELHTGVRTLVPLTTVEAIKDAVFAHCTAMSAGSVNQWRMMMVGNDTPAVQEILNEAGTGDLMVTIEEYGAAQYRKVVADGALFITEGVLAGDRLRINADADGANYDAYVIDRLVDEETLILVSGPAAPVAVAIQGSIWRTYTTDQYATALAAYPAKYNSQRALCVYADGNQNADGTDQPLYYMACRIAGQRSAMAPHAPQSRVTLTSSYIQSVWNFSRTQLNTIAAGGNWVVVKDYTGAIYTRHQLTSWTDPDDLLKREATFQINADSISYEIKDVVDSLYGRGNATPEMVNLIRQNVRSQIETIRGREWGDLLGSQISDYTITRLRIHPTLRDTIEVVITFELPAPLNNLVFTLNFSVSRSA